MNAANNATTLIREGRLFNTLKKYSQAKTCFIKAAELHYSCHNDESANWAYAAAAYMAIMNKQIDEGLALLNKAAQLGYTDLEKINDLAKVKNGTKYLGDLKTFRKIHKRVNSNAKPIAIVKYENQNIDNWKWMRFCEKTDLDRFMKRLPQFKASSEWDLFIKCLDWVNQSFSHDPANKPSNSSPVTILNEARQKKMFTCQEYAILFAAVMQTHRYPARVIALLKEDYSYGSGKGHWATEVWSNTLDKWVLFDPQNNCYWKSGKEALNAIEIRDFVLKKKQRLMAAYSKGKHLSAMKSWLDQFAVIWYYRNQNYFKNWSSLSTVEELSKSPALLFQMKPRSMFKQHTERDHLYPKMNKINHECQVIKDRLSFILDNSFAYFEGYEFSVTGTSWGDCQSKLSLSLKPGKNQILFRAKNQVSKPVGLSVVLEK